MQLTTGKGPGDQNIHSAPSVVGQLCGDWLQSFPIRNILVPQVGQTPCVAGLPFFMVIDLASFISFFARHFTQ